MKASAPLAEAFLSPHLEVEGFRLGFAFSDKGLVFREQGSSKTAPPYVLLEADLRCLYCSKAPQNLAWFSRGREGLLHLFWSFCLGSPDMVMTVQGN